MSRCPRRRGAFTLTELLVTLAITAVLLGLLLAAVQQVRAAAARAQCLNNLHQIGLALHGYHDSYNSFPPGVRFAGDPFPGMAWTARLLPYLEQSALWEQSRDAYARERDFASPPHPLGLVVKAFACPSDPRSGSPGDYHGLRVGFTDYLGVEGVSVFRRNGVLYLDSHVRFADITDGTSTTLMVGERPPSADAFFGWWYAGDGQAADGSGDSVLGVLERNVSPLTRQCPDGPYAFGPGSSGNQCDMFHFWSFHPGGAHFLFADGSVHFVPYSAASSLKALATRSGGEVAVIPD
jgi:prepilin-type N-terminal cleavage/methylation domain-containing protein/prepilin-type processing-associated H-X9-DG protein